MYCTITISLTLLCISTLISGRRYMPLGLSDNGGSKPRQVPVQQPGLRLDHVIINVIILTFEY